MVLGTKQKAATINYGNIPSYPSLIQRSDLEEAKAAKDFLEKGAPAAEDSVEI